MPRTGRKPPDPHATKLTLAAAGTGDTTPHPDTILLAVTGMSPAILTETVWALAQEHPAVLPHQVMVLTTSVGKEQIQRELFTPQAHFDGQCGWDCLRQKLEERGNDLKGRLKFDPESDDLRVLTRWDDDRHRKPPLSDIRTANENEAVADSILQTVRSIVENLNTHLIASIAGGRKTMGTLLYACMTLIGRETDRITHVLVNEPFDDPRLSPRFYFPDQPATELTTPEKRKVSTAAACISLADVPFVPLRNIFQKEFGRKPGSFMQLIDSCREDMRRITRANIELTIKRSKTEFEVNGGVIQTNPREQLLLLFLAEHAVEGKSRWAQYIDAEDELNAFRERLIRTAPPDSFSDWRHHDSLKQQIRESTADHIRKLISKLREKCHRKGGDAVLFANLLPRKGRFALDLPRRQISVID